MPGPDGTPLGTKVHKPQDVYPEVRGVAPDLLVYFGDLEWRSVGSVGNPSVYTFENDIGPDGANHDRTGVFAMKGAPGQPNGKVEGLNLVDVGPTILSLYGIDAIRGALEELPMTASEQQGFTVWFTGLSGSGKSTIAEMLYHELQARGLKTEILDGDVVRQNLSKGLGFSKEDRDTNILRIGFVADLLTRNGVATICCPISPYKAARDAVRAQIGTFVEVYVHATVEEIAAHRDPKGLYKKALAGEITGFTGVDDPYEAPEDPELVVDTLVETPEESLQKVMDTLARLGHIDDPGLLVEGERLHSGLTDLRVTDPATSSRRAESPSPGRVRAMDVPTSPDPVSEPQAYQEHLLSLLGQDDPAEVQARAPELWRALVADAGERGHARPARFGVVGDRVPRARPRRRGRVTPPAIAGSSPTTSRR